MNGILVQQMVYEDKRPIGVSVAPTDTEQICCCHNRNNINYINDNSNNKINTPKDNIFNKKMLKDIIIFKQIVFLK